MSMMPSKRMVLSASRVKNFLDCSWLFYQTYFLKVPDHTHPKTKLGSLVHSILEAFCKKRHQKHRDLTLKHQSVYGSPVITRMAAMFRSKNPDVTDAIMADLDKLVFVALNHDFDCKGAKEILAPEHAFEIDFGDFSIKGFMDRVALYDNVAIVRDYKTQSKRFTEQEMEWNLQAMFYQIAAQHQFGLPAKIEFLLLRFPANKKDPTRYIQAANPINEDQIEGFKYYLLHINQQINALTPEIAKENLKAHKDEGFCLRVCSLKDPIDYWTLIQEDKPLKSIRIPKWDLRDIDRDEWAVKELAPKEGQRVEKRHYSGCCHWYTPSGQRRGYSP